MTRLEQLTPDARVRGLIPERTVEVVQLAWHGTEAATLTYRDGDGRVGEQLLYRDDEARLELEAPGAVFAFDGNGALFRLASEALRIRLAYIFDPLLAVHTSVLEPLPHQIKAVYGELLPRQPLRFLLTHEPGLFPERRAYGVEYRLSGGVGQLIVSSAVLILKCMVRLSPSGAAMATPHGRPRADRHLAPPARPSRSGSGAGVL